jgi:hypothetical protein
MPSPSNDSFDNPWESPTNDLHYKRQHQNQEQSTGEVPSEASDSNAAATTARLDWANESPNRSSMNVSSNNHNHNQEATTRTNRQSSHTTNCCKNMTPQHASSTLDGLITLFVLIFVGYTFHEDTKDDNGGSSTMTPQKIVIIIVSIFIAIMITVRGLLTSCLFPNKRCSKKSATNLTLFLCGSYAILASSAWIILNKRGNELPWCWSVGSWCSKYTKALPITLTVLCFIESLRWIFAQGKLSQFDQDHSDLASQHQQQSSHDEDSFTTSRRHRPWWWNRHNSISRNDRDDDNNMHEALLGANGQPGWSTSGNRSYLMDDGVGERESRGFLGGLFGRSSSSNNNPRDDGSVDYASLNEEWASRSEEDPYWWTREENNQQTTARD